MKADRQPAVLTFWLCKKSDSPISASELTTSPSRPKFWFRFGREQKIKLGLSKGQVFEKMTKKRVIWSRPIRGGRMGHLWDCKINCFFSIWIDQLDVSAAGLKMIFWLQNLQNIWWVVLYHDKHSGTHLWIVRMAEKYTHVHFHEKLVFINLDVNIRSAQISKNEHFFKKRT